MSKEKRDLIFRVLVFCGLLALTALSALMWVAVLGKLLLAMWG